MDSVVVHRDGEDRHVHRIILDHAASDRDGINALGRRGRVGAVIRGVRHGLRLRRLCRGRIVLYRRFRILSCFIGLRRRQYMRQARRAALLHRVGHRSLVRQRKLVLFVPAVHRRYHRHRHSHRYYNGYGDVNDLRGFFLFYLIEILFLVHCGTSVHHLVYAIVAAVRGFYT